MKNLKNIVFPLLMLIGAQSAMAMQLPSYWSAIKPEATTLAGVPTELKQYLLPFIASGDPKKAAESILALAQVDKAFRGIINNEDTMLALLNGLSDAKAVITFIEQLQKYSDILPVMNRPVIITRLEDAKQSLINPEDVARAALLRQQRIDYWQNLIQLGPDLGVVVGMPAAALTGLFVAGRALRYSVNAARFLTSSVSSSVYKDYLWSSGLFEAISDIIKREGLSEVERMNCVQNIIAFASGTGNKI